MCPPQKLLIFQPSEVCPQLNEENFPLSTPGREMWLDSSSALPCSPHHMGTHLELLQTLPFQLARQVPDAPGQADVERWVLKTKQG